MREACAVGKLIRDELSRRKWSADTLAKILGCSGARVSYILTGERPLGVATALKMGAAGRRAVEENFSEERFQRSIAELYAKLVPRRG